MTLTRFEKRFFPEFLVCVPLNLTCCCFLNNSFQKLSRKVNFQLDLAVSVWYVCAQCLVAPLLLCISHGSKVVSSILMMHLFVWAVLYAIIFGVPPVLLPPLCNVFHLLWVANSPLLISIWCLTFITARRVEYPLSYRSGHHRWLQPLPVSACLQKPGRQR